MFDFPKWFKIFSNEYFKKFQSQFTRTQTTNKKNIYNYRKLLKKKFPRNVSFPSQENHILQHAIIFLKWKRNQSALNDLIQIITRHKNAYWKCFFFIKSLFVAINWIVAFLIAFWRRITLHKFESYLCLHLNEKNAFENMKNAHSDEICMCDDVKISDTWCTYHYYRHTTYNSRVAWL